MEIDIEKKELKKCGVVIQKQKIDGNKEATSSVSEDTYDWDWLLNKEWLRTKN